jgi:hypothetical protein
MMMGMALRWSGEGGHMSDELMLYRHTIYKNPVDWWSPPATTDSWPQGHRWARCRPSWAQCDSSRSKSCVVVERDKSQSPPRYSLPSLRSATQPREPANVRLNHGVRRRSGPTTTAGSQRRGWRVQRYPFGLLTTNPNPYRFSGAVRGRCRNSGEHVGCPGPHLVDP